VNAELGNQGAILQVEKIQAFRLSLPLREPYRLSYGALQALESVWIRAQLDDGSIGWGESTPLEGYSDSNIEAVWHASNVMACSCIGKNVWSILHSPHQGSDGFHFSAVCTALEEASGAIPRLAGKVPLVGITQERANESPQCALRRVRGLGYRVFKVKVGFGPPENDLRRLTAFQNELRDGERIRIDANQSLSEEQATLLLSCCAPERIELFEQPLPADAWSACSRLALRTSVPIMLDEAITDLRSLEQAAQTGAARIVKLKLMKQGSLSYLRAMVDRAKELGLGIVLGNGVAGWIDNRHEAMFWLAELQESGLAGEMNGHLKISAKPPWVSMPFADGCLDITTEPSLQFDMDSYPLVASQAYSS
jgi:L-Ala-D/L-Glu epimerase